MSVSKVKIYRTSGNGVWKSLKIRFKNLNGRYSETEKWNLTNGDKEFVVSVLLNSFLTDYSRYFLNADLDELKSDIVEGFSLLREDDLDGGTSQVSIEIDVVPGNPFQNHFSCKDKDSTPQAIEENEITQSAVKQKLVNLDKDSTNIKFFEENKCSVCLSRC